MAQAKRDENRVTTLIGVSSIDNSTPTNVAINPVTLAQLVEDIQTSPTSPSQNNPSFTLTRNVSNYITSIAQLIGSTTYTKTFTRDGNNYISAISAWS